MGKRLKVLFFATSLLGAGICSAVADQGGIGYWLPGAFGSLAATPLEPGWSMGAIYLHSAVSAGGDVAASRAIGFPNRTVNLTVNLDAQIKGRADIGILSPGYVFSTPVLGGQFAINVLAIYGRQQANIDATLTGSLGPIGFGTARSISQSMDAWGDVFVQPSLRWNQGVHSYMIYGMTSLPVGAYIRHASSIWDWGTLRSMSAAATPTSIRRPEMNSRQ